MTPPCGVPRVLPLPPVMRRFPSPSRSSTGAFSHSLISRSTCRSTMRRATDLHQLAMRDRVEVLGQIGVHHIGVAPAEQPVHFLDRVAPLRARPVAIGTVLEVRLEDRLQHQLGGGLHHPVPDRRDAERPLAAAGLRDHHPPHRRRPVRLRRPVPPAGPPATPPAPPPRSARSVTPSTPGAPAVGAGQRVGVAQDVLAVDLVVEQVEAEGRLRLRLAIQLPLKGPDLLGCCQAHRQSPSSSPSSKAHQKSGPFPPPALPGLSGTMTLSDSRQHRRPSGVGAATPVPHGSPPMTRITLPACRAHYPGGSRRVRRVDCFPAHAAFPEFRRVGIRNFTFEACSGFTRVTARRIAQPPKAAFVTRLQPGRLPDQAARQLPDQSTTLWVEPSSTGDTRRRGALPRADMRCSQRRNRFKRVSGSSELKFQATIAC